MTTEGNSDLFFYLLAAACGIGTRCADVEVNDLLFTTRAQVYGTYYLAFLPGIAGAYGGSVMRRVIDNLRDGK